MAEEKKIASEEIVPTILRILKKMRKISNEKTIISA